MRLLAKTAIVTGAGSGIGRAVAVRFASEGAKVVVADINQEGGLETVHEIRRQKGEAGFITTDVSVADDCKRMVEFAVEKYGGLDILHNNAFYAPDNKAVVDTDEEEWDRTIAVTLKGVFLGSRYALPIMIEKGGGVVINTASVIGLIGAQGLAAYGAAKGGVIQLTRSIACDYGSYGIRANAICPGLIETPATANMLADSTCRDMALSRLLIKRLGEPEDIANAALFLASDESSYITGSLLIVDGGRSAI